MEKTIRKSYPGVPFAKPKTKVGRPKGRKYTIRKEIGLDIDDVRDLFEKTKEFLDWYDKGIDEIEKEKI